MCDEPSTGDRSEASGKPDSSLPDPRTLESDVCAFESVEYCPTEGTYRATYDADAVAPSTAAVGLASAVADVEPTEMEPLHSRIDADALDSMLGGSRAADGEVRATFTFDDFRVTLASDGRVEARPRSADGVPDEP